MGNVRLFTDRHGEFVKNSGTDALRVQLAVSRYPSGSTCYRWLSQFCETSPVGAISRIFIVNHANTREILYAGMRKHEMLALVVADIIACHIMNYNNAEIYVHVAHPLNPLQGTTSKQMFDSNRRSTTITCYSWNSNTDERFDTRVETQSSKLANSENSPRWFVD